MRIETSAREAWAVKEESGTDDTNASRDDVKTLVSSFRALFGIAVGARYYKEKEEIEDRDVRGLVRGDEAVPLSASLDMAAWRIENSPVATRHLIGLIQRLFTGLWATMMVCGRRAPSERRDAFQWTHVVRDRVTARILGSGRSTTCPLNRSLLALFKMSEDPVGVCCSLALVACLDVCTGFCIDFASIRHRFPETMFRCITCGRTEKESALEDEERAPLIQQTQPTASRPMPADDQ